ncbi:hypothetical protein COH20_005584 [Aspergillus flavus]|nr:hypothetical protein COH20_005584 [Aspergillus flavus]RAQ69217.1 hypothetical protein COH21_012320 [Aspergillus flavus]
MPPKRKPETVTQEEVALTQLLADDEGHTTAGRTHLGDIAIHVDHLETDTYRNRERDEDHNARLVQTFTGKGATGSSGYWIGSMVAAQPVNEEDAVYIFTTKLPTTVEGEPSRQKKR